MASPIVQKANDENLAPGKTGPMAASNNPNRRVLGDVSPNVKITSPAIAALNTKPMQGSPLKRSFTAMMEDGSGFTYLKKRRVSLEKPVVRDDGPVEQTQPVLNANASSEEESMRFRPLEATEADETNDAAVQPIQEPEPSPTEPATPSDNGEGTQGSSVERKSFSSLINYDPSSQVTTSHLVFKQTSKAEMLRLRLRVAMYKVRTNQVDVPFDQLHVAGENKLKSASQAVEEAVAQLRKEAREAQEAQEASTRTSVDDRPFPKLLPAPVLKPTAYSSRMIYATALPSSPSPSASPERLPQSQQLSTPARHQARQLSSPPDSAEREMIRREEEPDVTSSVMKGRVAEGLLGLRNAA